MSAASRGGHEVAEILRGRTDEHQRTFRERTQIGRLTRQNVCERNDAAPGERLSKDLASGCEVLMSGDSRRKQNQAAVVVLRNGRCIVRTSAKCRNCRCRQRQQPLVGVSSLARSVDLRGLADEVSAGRVECLKSDVFGRAAAMPERGAPRRSGRSMVVLSGNARMAGMRRQCCRERCVLRRVFARLEKVDVEYNGFRARRFELVQKHRIDAAGKRKTHLPIGDVVDRDDCQGGIRRAVVRRFAKT